MVSAGENTLPDAPAAIREVRGADPRALPGEVLDGDEPVVLRGLVTAWPLVQAGLQGARQASDYLLRFYRGAPVRALVGPAEICGRFFYNQDLDGFNFRQGQDTLDRVLTALATHHDDIAPPALYVGATAVENSGLAITSGLHAAPASGRILMNKFVGCARIAAGTSTVRMAGLLSTDPFSLNTSAV